MRLRRLLERLAWEELGAGSRSVIVGTMVAASIFIGAYAATQGGGSEAAVLVATSGNNSTCIRNDDTKPCLSFDCAYHVAQNGDTVDVATGNYGPQLIQRAVPAGCTNGTTHYTESDVADITIQPASGATVTVGDLMLGAWWNQCGNDTNPADPTWSVTNLTIKNISDNNNPGGSTGCGQVGGGANDCMWQIAGSSHITWDNITTCTITIVGSTTTHHVLVENSDLGDCFVTEDNGPDCYNNKIVDGASYVTFDNVLIHDILLDPNHPGDPLHGECLFIGSNSYVHHITVRRSTFYNCDIYDVFVQTGNDYVTFENNFFDPPLVYGTCCGDRAIALSTHGRTFTNILVRYNSFAPGATINWDDDTSGLTYTNSHFYGNIIQQGCPGHTVVADYNIVIGAGTCGANDQTAAGADIFVNWDLIRDGGNLHLKSGANAAVGFVTPTSLYFDLGLPPWTDAVYADNDIDGDARDLGNNDAGADQR